MMLWVRVDVIFIQASYSWSVEEVGSTRPNPPSFVGRARRALSSREQGGLPVMAGINF